MKPSHIYLLTANMILLASFFINEILAKIMLMGFAFLWFIGYLALNYREFKVLITEAKVEQMKFEIIVSRLEKIISLLSRRKK